ncbi:DNA cytosine methyltransferase [Alkalimonas collagenimarina]|uniref:Cytosine-specific methyltransferase n=1 Tax=Alkalimonas collagenimarina TaxID=400390 RepID=A0ABT9GW05_9GAMM|nr:DNA cytosine methyltransferase [Alkalimonas collagenimarina]MDP4535234.1 DNA cytosine methyltransferase [Alkalimonas collagenimarina]
MQVVGVDLFCGAGGLTHGLKKTGITVKAGVDIDLACKFPYEVNNNAVFLHKSVSEISGAELLSFYPSGAIKLLAGCAPCQPFSKYSQGRPRDERWGLLYHFSRLIDEILPDLVTMENVPELLKHGVYLEFKSKLIDSGYSVKDKVVFCPDYGMAQTRRRLVLVASRMGNIDIIPATHKPSEYQTVYDAISHLPELKAGEVHPDDPLHRAGGLTEINLKRIRASKPNGTWRDWPNELVAKCHLKDSGRGYSSVYGRMAWNEPSPTMTTQCYGYGNGRFGHPSQDRAISFREAAILQSFPDSYQFAESQADIQMAALGRMIGNAVPVRLGEVVGLSIKEHIKTIT